MGRFIQRRVQSLEKMHPLLQAISLVLSASAMSTSQGQATNPRALARTHRIQTVNHDGGCQSGIPIDIGAIFSPLAFSRLAFSPLAIFTIGMCTWLDLHLQNLIGYVPFPLAYPTAACNR